MQFTKYNTFPTTPLLDGAGLLHPVAKHLKFLRQIILYLYKGGTEEHSKYMRVRGQIESHSVYTRRVSEQSSEYDGDILKELFREGK